MKNLQKILPLICLIVALSPFIFYNLGAAKAEKLIRMGHILDAVSGVDINDAKIALEILLNRILKKGLPEYTYRNILFHSTDSAVQQFNAGQLEILSLTSINYLNIRNLANLEPAFVAVSGGNPENKYVLLIQKKAEINTLNKLNKKNLIIEKGNSGDIALLWLNTLLLERSLKESDSFFNNIKRVDKVSQAVLPVFFGQADVCIVRRFTYETMIELNPQVGNTLTTLFESPPFLFALTCFHPEIDKQVSNIMKKFSNTLAKDPEGRQLLLLYHIEKVLDFRPEYLENIETLYNKYNLLKKQTERVLQQ